MSTYTFTKVEHDTNIKQALTDGMISLTKSGRIGLGRQFVEQHGVSADSRADLYWDSENKAIAIAIKTDSDDQTPKGNYVKVQPGDGYTVGFVKGDAGYILSSSFFQKIGVDPTEYTGRYRYEVLKARDAGITDVDSDVFVVRLAQ